MKNSKAKIIAECSVCVALTVLLLTVTSFVPLFALFSIFICGLPLTYLGTRFGTRYSSLSAVAAILLLFVFTGNIISAILYGVVNLLPGVVIGYIITHRGTYGTAIVATCGTVLFGVLLQLILFNATTADGNGIQKLVTEVMKQVEVAMQTVVNRLPESGEIDGANLTAALTMAIDQMEELIFLYLPGFLIMYSVVLGYGALMVAIFMLRRLRVAKIDYFPFSQIHASKGFCYATMILYFIAIFSQDTTIYTAALKNLVMLSYAFIAVSGLSLIDFFLKRKVSRRMGRFALYLGVGFVAYLFLGQIIQILITVGLIDGMFHFRRFYKAGDSNVKYEKK